MLRSLDPDKNFEAPKSKQHRPTASEMKKFSPGELAHIDETEKYDNERKVRIAVNKKQQEAILKDL